VADYRLAAETRTEFGKGSARRTRRAGRIPAVLYAPSGRVSRGGLQLGAGVNGKAH